MKTKTKSNIHPQIHGENVDWNTKTQTEKQERANCIKNKDIFLTLLYECEIQIIKQCEALGGEVYCLQYKVITHIHHSGYKWKSFPSSRQAVK